MDVIDAVIQHEAEPLLRYLCHGGDPNLCEDAMGVTLLHHAVNRQNFFAIVVLMEFGADPFRRERLLQESPLELAISNQRWASLWVIVSRWLAKQNGL